MMKRKSLKLFLVLGVVLLSLLASGCTPNPETKPSESDTVTVNFIIDNASYPVKIAKGSVLTEDDIPLKRESDYAYIQFFYDANHQETYSNEVISEDVNIYVAYIYAQYGLPSPEITIKDKNGT